MRCAMPQAAQVCVIIPVAIELSEAASARINKRIAELVPKWADFEFAAQGKYLGWRLGPGAFPSLQWEAVATKFRDRVEAIAASGDPAVIGARLMNERASPVLSYVPMFGGRPKEIAAAAQWAIHRILHWP